MSDKPKTPDAIVRKIQELRSEGKSYRKIGEALGVNHTTAHKYGKELPLSEQIVPTDRTWTKREVLETARKIAEEHPERVITRNYFRVNSGIPERAWRHYFGTWEELKRQARIIIPRQVRKLEMDISKHVSVDHYRAMTKEAANWGECYLRPSSKRFQTVLVAGDFHDQEADPFALRIFLETAERCHPETIVLAGDLFDLPEFSNYAVDPREWDVVGRIRIVHERILAPLRAACPDAQIDLIGGNHEHRILRLLADQTPVMMVLLSDLHGMGIAELLGLKKFQVNYVHRGDLSAWTKKDQRKELRRNFKVYHECFLVDHDTRDGMRKQMPGCSAHSHKHVVWSFESPNFGSYEWHQLGCMHLRDASYTDGTRWSVGFAMAHIDTRERKTLIEYVPIGEKYAVVGGTFYLREKEEEKTIGGLKCPPQ